LSRKCHGAPGQSRSAMNEHINRQYDQELEAMRSRILQVGGWVERYAGEAMALRMAPKRLRYCAGVRLTLRRKRRLKKPASS
jgi:hypothetical protein